MTRQSHNPAPAIHTSDRSQDETAIRAALQALGDALRQKDAGAALALYGERPVRYDLAPPLQQTREAALHRKELEDWFATWDGPVEQRLGRHEILIEGDLALVHGLLWLGGTKRDGTRNGLWFRITWALRRSPWGWRIVHEHQSVPFYMDGSFRAAVDLEPEAGS